MKRDDDPLEKSLARHLGLFGAPSASQLEVSRGRIRDRLRAAAGRAADAPSVHIRATHASPLRWRVPLSMAAAAALIVLVAMGRWPGTESLGRVEAADGSLYLLDGRTPQALGQGDSIDVDARLRSNAGAGAMLALADGSRIEMRGQSELSFERADDGMTIRLDTGGIIVNAAAQTNGHLYVRTKDMTVAVVGTVFVVNAEPSGSRVGVIEGEVRVREGSTETNLRPGQQVSTNRAVIAPPVAEEIAWSRRSESYRAILATFAEGMALSAGPMTPVGTQAPLPAAARQSQPAPPRQQFEEASIRPCDPDNIPAAPEGARGGGANSLQMTPGRTHALCLTLATIIRHAYGYGPVDLEFLNPGGRGRGMNMNNVYGLGVEDGRRVRGGPDWLRNEHYTIDAVADGAADAATMSGPMMRDLLERRFRLKTHIETEQIPAFAMSIAPGGLKIKPVADGACERQPVRVPGVPTILRQNSFADVRRGGKPSCGLGNQRNGPNDVLVAGEASFGALANVLGGALGGLPVLDKTGNTDKFNFVFEYVVDENTPGPPIIQPRPRDPSDVPRGQTIFTAIEQQLGLKLEPARAPRGFIVVDQVERPSAN
jgi:uncharacterized protein (TIGR03435 family)